MNDADPAKRRFFALQAVRLVGLVLLLLGILTLNRSIGVPHALGYVFVMIGATGFAIVPIVLSRRWRTPRR